MVITLAFLQRTQQTLHLFQVSSAQFKRFPTVVQSSMFRYWRLHAMAEAFMFPSFLYVRPILGNVISQESLKGISSKCPMWLVDELIRIRWPKVQGQGHFDHTIHTLGHDSGIYVIVMIKLDMHTSNRIKLWSHDIWYPEGQRLNKPWHHNIL